MIESFYGFWIGIALFTVFMLGVIFGILIGSRIERV